MVNYLIVFLFWQVFWIAANITDAIKDTMIGQKYTRDWWHLHDNYLYPLSFIGLTAYFFLFDMGRIFKTPWIALVVAIVQIALCVFYHYKIWEPIYYGTKQKQIDKDKTFKITLGHPKIDKLFGFHH